MAVGVGAAELRTSTEEELVTKLREAKEELFNLRFQAATGQLESHGRLRGVRKEIARIYTVMRERELGIVTTLADETVPAETVPAETVPAETVPAEAGPDEMGPDEAVSERARSGRAGSDETATDEAAAAAVAEEPGGDE
jgi:large subunit ribosomal protein L29